MENQRISKRQNKVTKLLLSIYLIVLVWIILMKMEFLFKNLPSIRRVNLIPFAESYKINNIIGFNEVYLNVLIFAPF